MLESHNNVDLESSTQPDSSNAERQMKNLTHYVVPTLAHLMAMIAHPLENFPAKDTGLIVADDISTLFALAFPKAIDDAHKNQAPPKKYDAAQFASGRRWAVIGDLISKLGRLAVTWNIAILLLGKTITRVHSDTGAVLCPAVSGTAWDSGISNRIVLFRDWLFLAQDTSSQPEHVPGARFAGITKAKGVAYNGFDRTVAFTIEQVNACTICNSRQEKLC